MGKMYYREAKNVTSPKNHLELVRIVFDGGINKGHDYSIAKVKYDGGDEGIAMRWNVSSAEYENPRKQNGEIECIGNPVSRGFPTWFVLPIKVGEEEKFIEELRKAYKNLPSND